MYTGLNPAHISFACFEMVKNVGNAQPSIAMRLNFGIMIKIDAERVINAEKFKKQNKDVGVKVRGI